MYRLAEMSDRQRIRTGTALLVVGTLLMVLGVIVVHIYGRPAEQVPVLEPFRSMFTSVDQDFHKFVKGFGYLIVFAASQAMVAGTALVWLLNQKMTWARAGFASFLTWLELVVIFGIAPSEWLNFSQTDLDWSFQRGVPGLDPLPAWIVLNNEVTISWGAVKDAVSGGYNVTMLALAGLFAYKVQNMERPKKAVTAEEAVSPYGRPLVKRNGKGEA
jgi:hypothetical protein